MTEGDRLTIITGGPGAGKTRRLLEMYLALPPERQRQSALLTATSGAARELSLWARERQPDRPAPRTASFPKFPRSILRMLRGQNVPQPLDETERRVLLFRLIAAGAGPDWAANAEALSEDVAAVIGLCQRYGLGPDDLQAYAGAAVHQHGEMGRLAALYRRYTDTLTAAGLYDFDSLGREVLRALEDPAALRRVRAAHATLFVDEAQNLDAAQVALIARVAGADGRIVAAVDPSQRTQAYRGACEDAAAEMERALGTPAARLAADGPGALPTAAVDLLGRLRAAYPLPGDPPSASAEAGAVRHVVARDADDEAVRIAALLESAAGSSVVLARSSASARGLRERLAARGVPVAAPETGEECLVRRFLADALRLLAYQPGGRHGSAPPLSVLEERAAVNAAAVRLLCSGRADLSTRSLAVAERDRLDGDSSCLLDVTPGPPLATVKEWVAAAREEAGLVRQVHSLFRAARPHVVPDLGMDAIVSRYGSALTRLERLEAVFSACGGTLTAAGAAKLMDALLPPASGGSAHASVEVLVATSAAGRRWDTVVLAGLNDGEFPQWAVPSPFFTDETAAELSAWIASRLPAGERVALGRFERGTAETLGEERRLFYSALARTRRDLVLSCRLHDGANDLAPSCFFLRCLPPGMAVASREASGDWRCVLGSSLPDGDQGLASCTGCRVEICAGRKDNAAGSTYRLEARTAPPLPVPSGPPALTPDWPLSASDIEAYCDCPRGYFLGRVLRVVRIEGDDLTRGNLLHQAFEAFHRMPRADRSPDALRVCVESALRGARKSFSTVAAWRLQERQALAALEALVGRPDFAWDYEVLHAEKYMRFSLTDAAGEPHPFVGRVDLVRSKAAGVEVVDFKASAASSERTWRNQMPCALEDGPLPNGKDISIQLPLYAIGLGRQREPVSASAIVLEYVHRKGCRTVPLSIGENGSLTPGDLASLERHVADLAARMKSGTFLDATRDGSCGGWDRACPCEAICD